VILTDIRDYLRGQGSVPLAYLASRFGVEAAALRGMLGVYERRRQLRLYDGRCAGGRCASCPGNCFEMVEWTGGEPGRP
jgi:hypothetical protein